MDRPYIQELSYHIDSHVIVERLTDLENLVWLDSAYPHGYLGRFDIIAAQPREMVTLDSYCTQPDHSHFEELKQRFAESFQAIHSPDPDLPFVGGAIGYWAYDAGRQLETLPELSKNDIGLADAVVGFYHWAIIQDHIRRRCVLVASQSVPQAERADIIARLNDASRGVSRKRFKLKRRFQSNMDREAYRQRFQTIKDFIYSGDCYQVNLAQRFSSEYSGDPLYAYLQLRREAKAPLSAYMELEHGAILSLSPERFLQVNGGQVETRPIKGTRPRHSDPFIDADLARELCNSDKDKAENLMIVDLLRNDLGKCCRPGSIHVDKLFALESYSNVHHLVSTIRGELEQDQHPIDLFAASFPGGSITGAPKIRAMEIIESLEPHCRSVYCGSIGYISADGKMDSNIAIRTLIMNQGRAHIWGGGGIVADSVADSEYQESVQKVRRFIECLESEFMQ